MKAAGAFIGTLVREPGFLFPVANCFVFAQTSQSFALIAAIINVMLSTAAIVRPDLLMQPLRLTMWMVLLSSAGSFYSGDFLPGMAGMFFAIGHFLVTSPHLQARPASLTRMLAHPAIAYGIGSILVGVQSGGGYGLTAHFLDHPAVLISVLAGSAAIAVASAGMAAGRLKYAMPFTILAGGNALNGLAGLLSGNILGAIGCFFSTLGGIRLGRMVLPAPPSKN